MTQPMIRSLCFHGIGLPQRSLDPGEDRYWITADAFHEILDAVAERPDVRISFDDGNASDVEIGLGGLLERGLVASFFVVAGRIGVRGSLDADGIRELSRQGMTIGTHGMDHRPWTRLRPPDRERELIEARESIAGVVGAPVDQAAVPLGLYDRRLLTDLKRLRYAAVHTTDQMASNESAWLQSRFSVLAADTVATIEQRVFAESSLSRRTWLATKSRLKRLR